MQASVLTLAMACVLTVLPVAAIEVAAPAADAAVSKAEAAQLSQAMADLGLALLRDQTTQQNSLNSPNSVTNAMGMVLSGAAGHSAQQLANLLQGGSARKGLLASYMDGLNPTLSSASAQADFRNANRIWLNAALSQTILPTYSQQIQKFYQSDAVLQSFDNPEQAVPPINAWIEEKTGGKISNMLSPEQLNPATRMVLANAVYFKGLWRTHFKKEYTVDDAFRLANGKSIQVPTMHATVPARFLETGEAQWLELPYGSKAGDSGWVMHIVLPPRGQSLAQFQQQLSGAQWHAAMARMRDEEVYVALPRFSMKGGTRSLRKSLVKLGVVDVFTGKADLSGIDGSASSLQLDDVYHRATIDVDEAGTVAAAATVVTGVTVVSAKFYTPFVADRPFLLFIVHKPTQTPVFVGRVMNPVSGG